MVPFRTMVAFFLMSTLVAKPVSMGQMGGSSPSSFGPQALAAPLLGARRMLHRTPRTALLLQESPYATAMPLGQPAAAGDAVRLELAQAFSVFLAYWNRQITDGSLLVLPTIYFGMGGALRKMNSAHSGSRDWPIDFSIPGTTSQFIDIPEGFAVRLALSADFATVFLGSTRHNFCNVCLVKALDRSGVTQLIAYHFYADDAAPMHVNEEALVRDLDLLTQGLSHPEIVLSPRTDTTRYPDPEKLRALFHAESVTVFNRPPFTAVAALASGRGFALFPFPKNTFENGHPATEQSSELLSNPNFHTWAWGHLPTGNKSLSEVPSDPRLRTPHTERQAT